MKIKILLIAFLAIFSCVVHAQKNEYPITSISDSLQENANAVVRLNQIDILISSQRSMNVKTKKVITVLNKKGLSVINAYEYYDKKTTIKNIDALVYDAFGNEIKKIKKKDFKDQSASGGGTLFSDNRVIFLDYTPINYPFTIIYTSESVTSNTAFIPKWYPVSEYNVSVEKSILNVTYPDNLGFKKKEINFSNFNIQKITETSTQLSYVVDNIPALKQEPYSATSLIFPRVMTSIENFNLEGIDGNATNWKDFGKWYSDEILAGTTELPDEIKSKIKSLVGTEIDPIKKAKIIYKYLQEKSRYVSIQVGIGGWKPMLASDVDRLGYGDCKALTNYTRALLDVVGVPSYNTLIYGGSSKVSLDSDFMFLEVNHMILCIPDNDKYIFLECTSQDAPFGYQANFTDDRKALIIKPDGGEIVRTKNYDDLGNSQKSLGTYRISENGNLNGEIEINSGGTQYDNKERIEKLQPTDKDMHYKEYWSNINNLKMEKVSLLNDKDKIQFKEDIQISANNYGSISGNKMIFVVNAYNPNSNQIKRVRNRKNPFEIQRGFVDIDEIAIELPKGFTIEFLPNAFELKGKFGEYKTEIIKNDNNNLVYKRRLLINKGLYLNSDYDDYRLFIEQISRNDNAKIILTKN